MPKNPRKTNNQRITEIIALFEGKVQDKISPSVFLSKART
jgi:hypothetical protein